jgi:hypothetical protein
MLVNAGIVRRFPEVAIIAPAAERVVHRSVRLRQWFSAADHIGSSPLRDCCSSRHSLRTGFMTMAAERDVELTRILGVTRQRDVRTVTGYVRRANLFKGHAGASFL